MKNVTFIAANEGKIELYADVDTMIIATSDVNELAEALKTLDISGAAGSSSLDFADEYGFDTYHGAIDLLTAALEAK